INEFLNSPKVKEVTDLGTRVQQVADKIEAQGKNPLSVAFQVFILGVPPTDIHEIEILVQEIEKRRGDIKQLSEQLVGQKLQKMFNTLNKAIADAKLGGQLN